MKQTAVDRAYEWLRRRILDGTFPPSSFIDEATVCEGAQVSRTPAREALNRLEGEGLVSLVPRRGAQVTEPSAHDLYDAHGARLMVERHAIASICKSLAAAPEGVRRHLVAMDAISDFSDADALMAYQAADYGFHSAMVESLGNRAISDFYDSLWRLNQWGALTLITRLRTHDFVERNRIEHHALADALDAHDEERALATITSHLQIAGYRDRQ